MNLNKSLLAITLGGMLAASASADEIEVLHYWTSGGEAAAAATLKSMVEAKGHHWKDFSVAGGGGENAATVLRSRVVSGSAPAAAQLKGLIIQDYGELGFLANIDSVAKAGKWDELLPPVVANTMKYDGKYVAVPVNVHRVNWMWANPEIFKKAGVAIPTTWDELLIAAAAIKKAGYTPIAYGGQAWQDSTVFEDVVLAIGGPDFFKKAFVDIDMDTLTSPTMEKAFAEYAKLKPFLDEGYPGRDWNLATSMVINGQAAMQFMGDWAKGEFTAAGQKPGEDYVCAAFPGTASSYTFNIDSIAMFEQGKTDKANQAQLDMAEAIMSPEFQKTFNLAKGSIPVRDDIKLTGFDSCALQSQVDFKATSAAGTLLPSMAHGMSTSDSIQGAIFDTVTNYFNSNDMTPKQATEALGRAVKSAI